VSKNKTERVMLIGSPKTCPFHHVLPIAKIIKQK
jgi:hypothetical protein